MKEINGYLLVKPTSSIIPVQDFNIKDGYLYQGPLSTRIKLPVGKWKVVDWAKDLSEEQWKGIVESAAPYRWQFRQSVPRYKNYTAVPPFEKPTASGHSLLKANNLNPNTTLILKKENQ